MGVLLTLLVAGLVILYLRSNRKARVKWLQNLGLPGQWVSQLNGASLSLSGGYDSGEYRWQTGGTSSTGRWNYRGSILTLEGEQSRAYTVQLAQPGVISLLREDGTAELFHKQSTNVVPLAKR
jgi:hypothetical protein